MAGGKGKPKSPEHRAAISAALKGRKFSEEHKQHLRERDYNWLRKHGYASREQKSPTWLSWHSMLDRVTNPNANRYDRYGGRGIRIHSSWFEFANFLADMGERPTGMTLDRIDNDGHYEPGNCRWADVNTQNNNRKYSTACKEGCTCKRHRRAA
jgi:hypothetical protein